MLSSRFPGFEKIIISLNNDSDKEKNRGEIGSLKSYLKLLNFFDRDKLIIHPPTASDFGDMNDEDFSLWNKKLNEFDIAGGVEKIIKKFLIF